MLATALRDLPPVDAARQLDVGDQHIRDPLLAPLQGLFSIARFDHVEAFFMQRLHDQFADEWVEKSDPLSAMESVLHPLTAVASFFDCFDADTGEEVANEDIVKGYKVDTGTFVEVTKEELEKVALESTRTIEIDEFVDRTEIDPRYLIRPYYLLPDGKVGHDAFAVIRETIREMSKVAIGRLVLRRTEESGCTPMPNSNDVVSNEMLRERVLSLLVVGASVLGGSAVLLIQALPPILHGFP